MPAITIEMTEIAYEKSIEVYFGKLTKVEAVDEIVSIAGMNRGSAKDYVTGISKLLGGLVYKRTFNTTAIDYILTQIESQFDREHYNKALDSVEQHIEYYQQNGNGALISTQAVLAKHLKNFNADYKNIFPDEIEKDKTYMEGAKVSITANAYERNITARNLCIQHYGVICYVCNFDFEKVYGDIGAGFIHVHHIVPIATVEESYQVDPIKDLRPVCPNCHAMLHRKKIPLAIEELSEKIKTRD
jgi:5-methylcytosine-specific restriction protein A